MNNKATDAGLSKIINRLELIKSLIALEEEESIEEQISKLQILQIDHAVKQILNDLNQKLYGKAIISIEAFINTHNQLSVYIDPEMEALRFEAKALEAQLQQLSDEKAELEKLVHEFGVRHNQFLGELILKILKRLKEKSKGSPQEAEAEKDYEDFNTNFETTKDAKIIELSEEEKKELKDNYRKASKICHPDVVDQAQSQSAHKIFMELNTAYERNDLQRVMEILHDLQQGKTFNSKSDTANEKLTLQVALNQLRIRLNELTKDIANIKASNIYSTIISIQNWDEYFNQTKQKLQEQLNQLENGR